METTKTRKEFLQLLKDSKYQEVFKKYCWDWFVSDRQLVRMIESNSQKMIEVLSLHGNENDYVFFKQFEPMDVKSRPRGFYLYTRTSEKSEDDRSVEIVNGKLISAYI